MVIHNVVCHQQGRKYSAQVGRSEMIVERAAVAVGAARTIVRTGALVGRVLRTVRLLFRQRRRVLIAMTAVMPVMAPAMAVLTTRRRPRLSLRE